MSTTRSFAIEKYFKVERHYELSRRKIKSNFLLPASAKVTSIGNNHWKGGNPRKCRVVTNNIRGGSLLSGDNRTRKGGRRN